MRNDIPGTLHEFGRVMLLLIVIWGLGLVLVIASAVASRMVGITIGSVDARDISLGVAFGYVTIFFVFPSLWWKNLLKVMPIVYGPALVAAMLTGALTSPWSSVMFTGLVLLCCSLAVAMVVPRFWDVSRFGRCRVCDYDMRGNVTGVCPECGALWKSPQ